MEQQTDKQIRNSLYNWIIKKGVVLSKDDRKEIKDILKSLSDSSKNPVNPVRLKFSSSEYKPKKRFPEIRSWRAGE